MTKWILLAPLLCWIASAKNPSIIQRRNQQITTTTTLRTFYYVEVYDVDVGELGCASNLPPFSITCPGTIELPQEREGLGLGRGCELQDETTVVCSMDVGNDKAGSALIICTGNSPADLAVSVVVPENTWIDCSAVTFTGSLTRNVHLLPICYATGTREVPFVLGSPLPVDCTGGDSLLSTLGICTFGAFCFASSCSAAMLQPEMVASMGSPPDKCIFRHDDQDTYASTSLSPLAQQAQYQIIVTSAKACVFQSPSTITITCGGEIQLLQTIGEGIEDSSCMTTSASTIECQAFDTEGPLLLWQIDVGCTGTTPAELSVVATWNPVSMSCPDLPFSTSVNNYGLNVYQYCASNLNVNIPLLSPLAIVAQECMPLAITTAGTIEDYPYFDSTTRDVAFELCLRAAGPVYRTFGCPECDNPFPLGAVGSRIEPTNVDVGCLETPSANGDPGIVPTPSPVRPSLGGTEPVASPLTDSVPDVPVGTPTSVETDTQLNNNMTEDGENADTSGGFPVRVGLVIAMIVLYGVFHP